MSLSVAPKLGPEVSFDGADYQLLGMNDSAVRLGNEAERMILARANVAKARAQPGTTCIFLGIEHLPALQDWPQDRPAIVIEKSQLYALAFGARHHKMSINNIKLITGQWGYCAHHAREHFDTTLFFQDLALLAMKLMQQPDEWYSTFVIYDLPVTAIEQQHQKGLIDLIHLVAKAKCFHLAHQARYDAIARQPRHKSVLMLLPQFQGNWQQMLNFLKPMQKEFAIEVLIVANPYIDWVRKPLQALTHMRTGLEAHYPSYEEFIERLSKASPTFTLLTNRSAFADFADCLFYEEIIRRCQIPERAFYTDLFSHEQTRLFIGGWSYFVYNDLWPAAPKIYYTMYRYSSMLAPPRNAEVRHFPLNYFADVRDFVLPVADDTKWERDVAIIHKPRLFSTIDNEINEIYEIVSSAASCETGRAADHFLYFLRQRLVTDPGQLRDTYTFESLINTIDLLFYCQTRIRSVIRVVKSLPHLHITVYGEDWHRVLPPEVCGGPIRGQEALHHVYRNSLITADFTQTFSNLNPHMLVIECLAAGGLPIQNAPFAIEPASQGELTEDLISFDGVAQFNSIVTRFQANPTARGDYIRQAQTTWLKDMRQAMSEYRFTDTPDTQRLSQVGVPTTITGNQQTDKFIVSTGIGYLYALLGFLGSALSIWQNLFAEGFHPLPLIRRAYICAAKLNNTKLKKQLRELALKAFPDHPNALNIESALEQDEGSININTE